MVESLFNKVAGLKAASILHLLIIFTQKLSRKEFQMGRKIQLKLQLQQIVALRISSSILAFTGKAIFNFLSLQHQQSFSFNIPGSEYAVMM